MSSKVNRQYRRSAAQLHGLAGVQREIRAQDSHSRRKYLREFNQAFREYDAVLGSDELQSTLRSADIVLIGDYHALASAQHNAASLLEQRALVGDRPVVLGVETIFARDQHIVDEWWRREIDENEFRQRIRFDLDWGYDWAPFYNLLVTARDNAEAVYALDCVPREDLRKISVRDRHAATKIAEVRGRHPDAVIFVLFGESHLAPGHLPQELHQQLPDAKILTVLQNIDALYWHAAGEEADKVEAVQVSDDVLCVFNATPLEKYESYRLFLDQWTRCDDGPDFAPTIYNLIDSLARFLEINRHSPHNGTQPKFLVDMLPEVYGGSSDDMLRRMLARKHLTEQECESLLSAVEDRGSAYIPEVNAFYIRDFQMMHAAEDAARFLHQACQGLPHRLDNLENDDHGALAPLDLFYARVMEHAVAFFGSRVLYPARPSPEPHDAANLTRAACEKKAQSAIRASKNKFQTTARDLGYRIGSEIYSAYVAGKVTPSAVRRLFLAHLDSPGSARKVCTAVIAKIRSISRSARSAQA